MTPKQIQLTNRTLAADRSNDPLVAKARVITGAQAKYDMAIAAVGTAAFLTMAGFIVRGAIKNSKAEKERRQFEERLIDNSTA